MKKIFSPLMLLTFLAISGCARMVAWETPYDKESAWDKVGGYSDKQIGEGKFELTYKGNSVTSIEKIDQYWHRRAKELCNGEYTFEKNNNMTNKDSAVMAGSTYTPISLSIPVVAGIVTCKTNSE
ncbi:CC0125/CC1285 family lipoprotein [Rheinheimera sp. MM224]|uniref:CC0125/CC1285 family lipoprotein n=1 Tax=Rheinheimera sp. MM224 TaxID=3019969 RepID=UPI0021F8230B|nr:hypothetical protein [Rheinheimera sp. MM224]CAI3801875.1 hypothetical protein JAMGFMIE_02958 [Rheinheimera sp. MM224]